MEAVVFDLGKVLLDWSPRYYYERFFADEPALERFLAEAVSLEWIHETDRGKPMDQAIAERQGLFPEHADLLARWKQGWPEMLRGEIAGTVAVLEELRSRGQRLYALTNFSAETFPIAQRRSPSLRLFADAVVSGEIGLVKPDPRIFALAIERCQLSPGRTAYVDDMPVNVDAGRAAGLRALHFTTPDRLREDLRALGAL